MELDVILQEAKANEAGFRSLYDLSVEKVFHYILRRTGNRQAATEVTQDVYVSLWKSLARFQYESDAQFYGYLFTIARRELIRAYTRNKKHESYALEDMYEIPDEVKEMEDYRNLLSTLETLPENYRDVISLRYFEDHSFHEISEMLGISEGNAKVIHHRALEKLKEKLQTYEA